MIVLKTLLTSLISVSVLFVLTKLIGYRQISEMSVFDYVNSITVGSIAAEMAVSDISESLPYVCAMVFYGGITFLLSVVTNKSPSVRKFVEGSPIVLMENGKLSFKEMKKARIDLSELLENCRIAGYFDLSVLDTVVLESNGRMSFIPSSSERPVISKDIGVSPPQEKLSSTVITDGKIEKQALRASGIDEKTLFKLLSEKNVSDLKDVFLATLDQNGSLNVFLRSDITFKNKI